MHLLVALPSVGRFATFLFYLLLDVIHNGPYLRLTPGFTDQKEISNRLGNLAQVQGNNVLPLFLLNGGEDGLE